MSRRLLLATLAAAALGGCVAGPGKLPTAAEVQLPPAFRFAPDAGTAATVEALLPATDPAWQALSAAALADGPDLAAALARIEAARASAARAGAERLPAIDGSATVERSRASDDQIGIPAVPGIDFDRTRTLYGANLSARWDADLFGSLRARERAARARIDAASAEASAVRLALLAEVAGAVIDWRTLAEREGRARADLAAADGLVRLSGSRARAGLSPGFDQVQAETVAASSRAQIAALDSARALLIGRLVTLVARPAAEVERMLALPAPARPLGSAVPATPSLLLSRRPDVLAADARLRAASGEVAAAAAERFPKISLSAGLGLLSATLGGLFDLDRLTGSLGAAVAGPLLDFGRVAADIDRAEADTAEAFARYRGTVFTALGDAEGAYAGIIAADRALAAAEAEAGLGDRAAALAATRYRAGLTSFAEVLDARRVALAAGGRAADARGRAARARLLLWQALGGS